MIDYEEVKEVLKKDVMAIQEEQEHLSADTDAYAKNQQSINNLVTMLLKIEDHEEKIRQNAIKNESDMLEADRKYELDSKRERNKLIGMIGATTVASVSVVTLTWRDLTGLIVDKPVKIVLDLARSLGRFIV